VRKILVCVFAHAPDPDAPPASVPVARIVAALKPAGDPPPDAMAACRARRRGRGVVPLEIDRDTIDRYRNLGLGCGVTSSLPSCSTGSWRPNRATSTSLLRAWLDE
jgi:hypothetical protein